MDEYQEVLGVARREDNEVLAAFRVGSQVYGTDRPESDRDYMLVLNTPVRVEDVARSPRVDVVVRGVQGFKDSLWSGNIFSVECVCAPLPLKGAAEFSTFKIKERTHLQRVLFSALEKAKADFNKGVKVNDPKRVYHAFRVLRFAQQILRTGYIHDFTVAREIYETVMTEPKPLDEAFAKAFDDQYRSIRDSF